MMIVLFLLINRKIINIQTPVVSSVGRTSKPVNPKSDRAFDIYIKGDLFGRPCRFGDHVANLCPRTALIRRVFQSESTWCSQIGSRLIAPGSIIKTHLGSAVWHVKSHGQVGRRTGSRPCTSPSM